MPGAIGTQALGATKAVQGFYKHKAVLELSEFTA